MDWVWHMSSLLKTALRGAFRAGHFTMRTSFQGRRFYFDPSTDIGWQLLVHGKFEHREFEVCRSFIDSKSTVIDIGANIGLHTVAFSKAASDGLVIAIEPSPRTFRWLLRNTEGLSNVVTLNVAVSSQCGISEFFVTSDDAYSGLKDTGRKALLRAIQVPCYTADHIVTPLLPRKVDLIKVDVEGLETEVVSGMRNIISRDRPVIFCEIYAGKASNPDPLCTIRSICNQRYRAYSFDGQNLRSFTTHDDNAYNYFFVPEEEVARYPMLTST